MNLIEQWHYEVDPFALKSEFCVICVLLIYILLYFILTKMLFYSMKNSENKKILQIMPCRFSNDLFKLKKCRILDIENLTSSSICSGIKLSMNIVLISVMMPSFLKNEIKIRGQWCKNWDMGQNIHI